MFEIDGIGQTPSSLVLLEMGERGLRTRAVQHTTCWPVSVWSAIRRAARQPRYQAHMRLYTRSARCRPSLQRQHILILRLYLWKLSIKMMNEWMNEWSDRKESCIWMFPECQNIVPHTKRTLLLLTICWGNFISKVDSKKSKNTNMIVFRGQASSLRAFRLHYTVYMNK